MHTLERQQWVPTQLDVTFDFFARAENLEQITPPWLGFDILTPTPIAMSAGTLIDYRIRLAGLPMRWRTRIDDWTPGERFVDVQLRGPYATWIHTHTFRSMDGGTLLTDVVKYQLRMGVLGRAVHATTVQGTLARIFDYRYSAIRRVLNGDQTAVDF